MNEFKIGHWWLLIGMTVVLIIVSLFLGRYAIAPQDVVSTFFSGVHQWACDLWNRWLPGLLDASGSTVFPVASHETETLHHTVIFRIRLPRILAAVLVGAGVSVAGCSFQGLFKNPLVSPDLLGVASGAGFGAALGILLSGRPMVIQVSAFLAGIIAVSITYAISRIYRSTVILVLVLSGIIVGAVFSALIALIKYVADPYDTLPAIVFWLMGSLASVTGKDLGMAAPPILSAAIVLFIIRWRINLLAMGDDEARTLGVNTKRMTKIIILCATVITASAVCISGIVGWIGLVVPHMGRLLVGPDFRKLIPASALLGAAFLLTVDNLSRIVFPMEIPLGILTAIIGAPLFAWLLGRRKLGWL